MNKWVRYLGILVVLVIFSLFALGSGESSSEGTIDDDVEISEAAEETEEPDDAENDDETNEPEQDEKSTYDVPEGFTDGYIYGDYSDFTDSDSIETLMGEKVWIKGAVTSMGTAKLSDDVNALIFEVTNESDERWCAILGLGNSETNIDSRTSEYNYEENGVCIVGVYIGMNGDYPVLVAHRYFGVATGEEGDAIPDYVYTYEESVVEAEDNQETAAAEETPTP